MRTRIQNATIVNEGKRFVGTVTLEDDKILSIVPSDDTIHTLPPTDRVIDAEGLYLIPGVIDDHVHFREPGLTHKADIAERRAADHHSRSLGRQVPVGSGKEPRQLFFLLRGHPYEH